MTIKSESQRYSKHLNPVPKNDFEHSLMLKERVKNEGFHILKNIKILIHNLLIKHILLLNIPHTLQDNYLNHLHYLNLRYY